MDKCLSLVLLQVQARDLTAQLASVLKVDSFPIHRTSPFQM